MFKKLILDVLLKRSAGAVKQGIGKVIRHHVTALGGALVADGLISGGELEMLTGGAVVLGSIAVSVARIKLQKYLD